MLVISLLALIAPEVTRAEQRVTELSSPGTAMRVGCRVTSCPAIVTPDGRSIFFGSGDGQVRSTRGVMTPILGPVGKRLGLYCNPYVPCHLDASDDGQTFAATCSGAVIGLCLHRGGTTELVAQSLDLFPEDSDIGFVIPAVADLSADGSRLFYSYDHGGPPIFRCGDFCHTTYEYDGTSPPRPLPGRLLDEGMSPNGERLYLSTTTSLVPEDIDSCSEGQGCNDVYERKANGSYELISTGPSTEHGPIDAYAYVTPDGSHVILTTEEQLTPDDHDDERDWYLRARNTITLLNLPSDASGIRVSDDGGQVVFETYEPLVPEDTDSCTQSHQPGVGGCPDVYKLRGGEVTLVSTGPENANGAFSAEAAAISADGKRVLFKTTGALVSSDTDRCSTYVDPAGCSDVYERSVGRTTLLSRGSAPAGNHDARFIDASDDGRRVFFKTTEALTAADRDSCEGYRRCRDIYASFAGETTLVSTGPTDPHDECGPVSESDWRESSEPCPLFAGMSDDGTIAYFAHLSSLVSGDTDGLVDIYASGVQTTQCRPKENGGRLPKCWAGSGK